MVLTSGYGAGAFGSSDPTPSEQFATSIDERLRVVEKTSAILDDKLLLRQHLLHGRVRALYKLSRGGFTRLWMEPSARQSLVIRRAAAKRILRRDIHEIALLEWEIENARNARQRLNRSSRASIPELPARRSLARPTKRGSIKAKFGKFEHSRSRAKLTRRGVEISSKVGEPVVAASDGTIRYLGPLRGLGQCVVIEHQGFFTIVGRIEAITVAEGDKVERRQPIAVAVGRTVYLEVRLALGAGGFPIDPRPLLARD